MTQPEQRTPAVLALDTSSTYISAAVIAGDRSGQGSLEAGRNTGALLPGLVNDAMRDARCDISDVDVVAVGVGPAPYTSLRVGVMFARALAATADVAVVGACSLDITARSAKHSEPFVVLSDARRKEVYWAKYDEAGERVEGPLVSPRSWVQDHVDSAVVSEAPRADVLASWVISAWQGGPPPLSEYVGQWAAARDDAGEVEVPRGLLVPAPLYLRRPDAVEPVAASQ